MMEKTDLRWSGKRGAPIGYVTLATRTLTYASLKGRRHRRSVGCSSERKRREIDMQWEREGDDDAGDPLCRSRAL